MTNVRHLRIDMTVHEATLHESGDVTVDGVRYGVEAVTPGAWRVHAPDRSCLVHVADDSDGWWVHVDGRVHRLIAEGPADRRRRRPAQSDHGVVAPMPATVLAVHAVPGQAVRAGDTLLVLEAMKMELPVRAPRDGTIAAVRCVPGELVQPGVALVEIE